MQFSGGCIFTRNRYQIEMPVMAQALYLGARRFHLARIDFVNQNTRLVMI